MAIRQVEWSSRQRLSCSGCDDAPIILCIGVGLAAVPDCPDQSGTPQSQLFDFIDATIASTTDLGGGVFRYAIDYDDVQLANPVNLLTEGDVEGAFCASCMSEWVLALVGSDPFVRDDGGGAQTFVSRNGCEYPINLAALPTIVSADANNEITAGTDGGAWIDCATISACVPAPTIVSTDGGNVLTVGGDGGAFIDCAAIVACVPGTGPIVSADAGNIIIAGTDSGAYLDCAAVNACVPALGPIVSADGGNIITAGGDGGAFLDCAAVDACIPPIVSADADNIIVAGSDGGAWLDCPAVNGCVSPISASVQNAATDAALGPVDISAVGTYVFPTLTTAGLVLTNANTTRSMNISLMSDGVIQCDLAAGGIWAIDIEREVDAGGFVVVASASFGTFPGLTGLPLEADAETTLVFGPSESHIYSTRAIIRTIVGTPAGTSFARSGAVGFVGKGVII